MNPVLLKPQSEIGSQVVVQGRVVGTAKAREYQAWKPRLMAAVLDSFARLSAEADLVLVEGAGSASEVNLRAGDIANMGFARAADVPVVLVGDIDRGGVIASLVGTKAVLDEADAAMIRGFIVNRFRGDPSLFDGGMRFVAERTGWPALGLVPHFADAARLPAEDGSGLRREGRKGSVVDRRAGNAPDLQFRRSRSPARGAGRGGGSGRARHAAARRRGARAAAGLQDHHRRSLFIRAQGWDIDLKAHRAPGRAGARPLRRLPDAGASASTIPFGIEGEAGRSVEGLGLLDVATMLTARKRLEAVTGTTIARWRAASPATRCISARPQGPTHRARLRAIGDGAPRRCGLSGWARRRHLCARPFRR